MSLSVVVPAFNEGNFLPVSLQIMLNIPEFSEVIVVNDCSTDNTKDILEEFLSKKENHQRLIVLHNDINSGKGFCLQRGFQMAKGDYIAVQDADLEYDAEDIVFMYKIANHLLTFEMNILFSRSFTDVYCCHKLFKKKLLEGYSIHSRGFEVDAEFLSKMLKFHHPKIIETPSAYYGRTYEEGKKIRWLDFFKVSWEIFKIKIFS